VVGHDSRSFAFVGLVELILPYFFAHTYP
jgi:hypothetical protein